jgi:hypothetical protein
MVSNTQLVYYPNPHESIGLKEKEKLVSLIQNRRAVKRLIRRQSFAERLFKTIMISSILSATFLGIGALGCWGLELIEANTKPIVLSQEQQWRERKHICLGWMLFGLASFFGSASLGKKPEVVKSLNNGGRGIGV